MLEDVLGFYMKISSAATSTLVGSAFYPLRLPQKPPMPAITYARVGSLREPTHGGPTGFVEARIQFSCYAKTFDKAREIRSAVRDDLDGFKGIMPGLDDATVQIDGAFFEDEGDGIDDELDCFVSRVDITFQYQEVLPETLARPPADR
ncbi:MAG: DUF3168 domain-containing protein [Phycisphaerales bacterium]